MAATFAAVLGASSGACSTGTDQVARSDGAGQSAPAPARIPAEPGGTTPSAPRPLVPPGPPVTIPLAKIPDGGRHVIWVGDQPVEVRRSGRDVEARSLLCTHFGCPVQWKDAARRYQCPCHDGVYDEQGAVVSGPPIRALLRVPAVVERDSVRVGA